MKTLTKEELNTQVLKIKEMSKSEAIDYREIVSAADIDSKARNFMFQAIDIVVESFDEQVSAMAECSELREDEI